MFRGWKEGQIETSPIATSKSPYEGSLFTFTAPPSNDFPRKRVASHSSTLDGRERSESRDGAARSDLELADLFSTALRVSEKDSSPFHRPRKVGGSAFGGSGRRGRTSVDVSEDALDSLADNLQGLGLKTEAARTTRRCCVCFDQIATNIFLKCTTCDDDFCSDNCHEVSEHLHNAIPVRMTSDGVKPLQKMKDPQFVCKEEEEGAKSECDLEPIPLPISHPTWTSHPPADVHYQELDSPVRHAVLQTEKSIFDDRRRLGFKERFRRKSEEGSMEEVDASW